MTGPEIRQLALSWALEDFGAWLAKWRRRDDVTDEVDDLDDVDGLAVYEKND